MNVITKLEAIRQQLEEPLEILQTAERCLRAICKPLRAHSFSLRAATMLWEGLRSLHEKNVLRAPPPLFLEAIQGVRKKPPSCWVEAVTLIANNEKMNMSEIRPLANTWEVVRSIFENDCVKPVAPLFLMRMEHDPDEIFGKKDVLRWAWAIWFKPGRNQRVQNGRLQTEINYKGAYPAMSFENLIAACRETGLRPLSNGAEAALEKLSEACFDFESEGRLDLKPNKKEVEDKALRLIERYQPNGWAFEGLELLVDRVEAGDLAISNVIESRRLKEEISIALKHKLPLCCVEKVLDCAVRSKVLVRESINKKIYYLSTRGSPMAGPVWDPKARVLRFRGRICKEFRNRAENQILILASFQRLGWPATIDDPLKEENYEPERRLNFTVRDLKKGLCGGLTFGVTCSGKRVKWRRSSSNDDV